jgi:hypothetical protein
VSLNTIIASGCLWFLIEWADARVDLLYGDAICVGSRGIVIGEV